MAGRIPQRFIDDLMLRVDIVDVIEARIPLKKAGKEYVARCPFHEEKTPSFTVSPHKQFYHCFGCGAHGTAIHFLMEYERMDFREAVESLAASAGMTVPMQRGGGAATESEETTAEILAILEEAERFYRRQLREQPGGRRAAAYLKERGLSGEIAARFGLGYAPQGWNHLVEALGTTAARRKALLRAGLVAEKASQAYYDRFRHRVMFPIQDRRGRTIGFGGRSLDATEPKYLNSPETPVFHKGRELYGLHQARDAIRRAQQILVVEGYMDVLALVQFGVEHAVATLGTATTREHVERLFRFAPDVVFCFDGDAAGRKAAWRALEAALAAMRDGRQVSFLFLPQGEDPDTLIRREGAESFRHRLRDAMPLPEFLFAELEARADLSRLDGRARLAELARPLIGRLPDGVLRRLMLERLGELTGLAPQVLAPPFVRAPRPVRRAGPGRERRSLVRDAVRLLVHHPGLAAKVRDVSKIRDLELPGAPLLCELVEFLRARPGLSTGALIEHFRDRPEREHLEKLALRGHMMDEEDAEREFTDAIRRLEARTVDQMIDRLLAKDRSQGSSHEDKERLLALLREKEQLEAALARH